MATSDYKEHYPIVIPVPVGDIAQVRDWIRRTVLDGTAPESVQEFLFAAYKSMGGKR